MENNSKNIQVEMFEGDGFVQECLDSFDKNVSEIEAEYAFTNKSA